MSAPKNDYLSGNIRSNIGAGIFLSYLEPRISRQRGLCNMQTSQRYLQVRLEASKDLGASISPEALPLLGKEPVDASFECNETPSNNSAIAYSLLSRFPYGSIGFEKGSDVYCLAAPDVTVNCPVE